jgi:hypothetical protein
MGERWTTTWRGRCVERDMPDGTIQRHYISPAEIIRPGGTAGIKDERSPAIARSAAATVKPPVFLDSLSPSHEVTIGPNAEQDIKRECRRMRLACRNGTPMHESGGWLLSHPGFLNSVVVATPPGTDTEHGPTSMWLGVERLEAVRASYPHLVASGSWHLHPGDEGVAAPSVADRKAWELWRTVEGLDHHIGIIAVDRGGGWTDPRLFAWLTTPDYCERLALRMQ